jgi:polysaccharide pyruvyl transferase WcaK-like protein
VTTRSIATKVADELRPAIPRKPILMVGAYGYRNAGDEAMLAGLLRVTGRDGVTVVSRMPAETAATHRVRAIPLRAAPAALVAHPGLVIGGGGLFGRDMGLLGRLLPLAGLGASAARREVALVGIGVDRDIPRSARWLVGRLARTARAVVVRDAESRTALAELGVEAAVAPDLSSLVESAGRAAGRRTLEAAGLQPARRPVVGMALAGVDPGLGQRVERAVLAAVDAMPEVDFALLPMSRHPFVPAHNDELLCRRLIDARPRLRLVVPPDETPALLGLFEALAAAVCMRYHSLLFAERAGIPLVPIPYAEKCRHWIAERELPEVEPTSEALIAALRSAVAPVSAATARPTPRRTRAAA